MAEETTPITIISIEYEYRSESDPERTEPIVLEALRMASAMVVLIGDPSDAVYVGMYKATG